MRKPWAVIISQNGLDGTPCSQPDHHEKEVYELLDMLNTADCPPVQLFFTTEGVSLVTEDSPILDDLRSLEAKGVEIVTCRTCLDYMGLRDQVAVGRISTEDHLMRQIEAAASVVAL